MTEGAAGKATPGRWGHASSDVIWCQQFCLCFLSFAMFLVLLFCFVLKGNEKVEDHITSSVFVFL